MDERDGDDCYRLNARVCSTVGYKKAPREPRSGGFSASAPNDPS